MGAESLTHLKKLASNVPSADGTDGALGAGNDADDDDDDVPDLVENFDECCKNEAKAESVEGKLLNLNHFEFSRQNHSTL